jgi:uncharacterized protein
MIKVHINRANNGHIQSFEISGHANYAEKGQDIVCAGVSAVSFGTLNSIMKLTNVKPIITQGESGFLRCELPNTIDEAAQEKIQLLLEAMVISLQSIEEEYGKYMKIHTH